MHDGVVVVRPHITLGVLVEVPLCSVLDVLEVHNDVFVAILPGLFVPKPQGVSNLVNGRPSLAVGVQLNKVDVVCPGADGGAAGGACNEFDVGLAAGGFVGTAGEADARLRLVVRDGCEDAGFVVCECGKPGDKNELRLDVVVHLAQREETARVVCPPRSTKSMCITSPSTTWHSDVTLHDIHIVPLQHRCIAY